ncbi:MAG: peptidase domain-containing ABC transporter [Catenibacillus sp.]
MKRFSTGQLKEMRAEACWILKYVLKYKKAVLFYMFVGVSGTLMRLAGSLTSKYVIDAVTLHKAGLLLFMAVLFALTGLGRIVMNGMMTRMLARISLTVNQEILGDVYERILCVQWDAMNRYHSGDLLNRINADVSAVSGSVLGWFPSLITKSVHFLGSFIIIFYYDPIMALIALASAPVTVLLSRTLLKSMRTYNKKMRQAAGDLMSFTDESFQKLQTIKSLNLIDLFKERLKAVQGQYKDIALDYNEFSVRTSVMMSVLGMGISFACMGWGVYRLWTGFITYGTMAMFLQLARSLSADFSALVKMVPSAVGALTSAGRIMEVTDLPEEDGGNQAVIEAVAAEADQGLSVILENVCYAYPECEPVLENLNFQASSGEVVALVGASGSGKTTLLRLILGIIKAQSGNAGLYNNDGTSVPLSGGTRRLMAYVPQGNTLFSGSIADNLRMAAPNASDRELEMVLRSACAWDFVCKLPDGMYSIIGENGQGFSEGQAQRIAIARALLKRAPVILLDEATSALDETTEQKLLENIREYISNCTCIIVTHRTSILKICTRVYHMECDQIKEDASGAD